MVHDVLAAGLRPLDDWRHLRGDPGQVGRRQRMVQGLQQFGDMLGRRVELGDGLGNVLDADRRRFRSGRLGLPEAEPLHHAVERSEGRVERRRHGRAGRQDRVDVLLLLLERLEDLLALLADAVGQLLRQDGDAVGRGRDPGRAVGHLFDGGDAGGVDREQFRLPAQEHGELLDDVEAALGVGPGPRDFAHRRVQADQGIEIDEVEEAARRGVAFLLGLRREAQGPRAQRVLREGVLLPPGVYRLAEFDPLLQGQDLLQEQSSSVSASSSVFASGIAESP